MYWFLFGNALELRWKPVLSLDAVQPFGQFSLVQVLPHEPFMVAPAVSAVGVDVHHSRYTLVGQSLAVLQTVAQRHYVIVRTVHYEGGRSLLGHLLLVAVEIHQLL